MFFIPKPPSQLVLKKELEIASRNYISGMLFYLATCALAAYITYSDTSNSIVTVWFSVMAALAFLFGIFFIFQRNKFGLNPRKDFAVLISMLTVHSLSFTYLIYVFIPILSYEEAMILAVITVGLVAGAVTLTAPLLPAFYVLSYPSLMTLVVSLYYRPEPIFFWLAVGSFLLGLALTWFSITMTNTVRKSIEASFQKEELVKKLRLALIQTDEANRSKSVFLASASHDLRQPLHALGLLTETLGRSNLDDTQTEIHEHMLSAVDSTRTMLDSLLNISKLDAGAILSQPKPFLVQNLLQKLEIELAPTADENDLIYRTRECSAAAYSDPQIVELILRNLIANAIRYTNKGGLLIACRPKHDVLSIEVWDTGIGIADEKIDIMFREFQQLDNSERDATKGFGLGLAIAQGLATTIDSKITVHSQEGKGSVFRFELPRSTADIIPDLPSSSQEIDFSGSTVFVIDDDERVRTSMRSLMRSWGCTTFSGESAHELMEKFSSDDSISKVDLLLVDYRLRDGVTGGDTIQEIRKELGCHVPAIIITGDTATDRIIEAQSFDALLLHKPASAKQLRRMMQDLLSVNIKEPQTKHAS